MGLLKSSGVRWIGAGWTAFIAENLVLSENRTTIIQHLGDDGYHRLYNTLSSAACGTILYGYWRYGQSGPKLWPTSGYPMRIAALSLQAAGLVGFSQMAPKLQVPVSLGTTSDPDESVPEIKDSTHATPALSVRCPIDFTPKDVPADGVYALKRITRHPSFYSMALFGLGSALATPYASGVTMGVMPAIFAVVGSHHQESRYRRGMGGTIDPQVEAVTSNIPFVAVLDGRQSVVQAWEEMKHLNAGVGVALALLMALRRMH